MAQEVALTHNSPFGTCTNTSFYLIINGVIIRELNLSPVLLLYKLLFFTLIYLRSYKFTENSVLKPSVPTEDTNLKNNR